MARHEADREDLMREATALVRRCELQVPGLRENVIAGLRAGGGLSIYFGPDPVYHLDEASRLRRAYAGGSLYRRQGTTLARLERNRTAAATELIRHDLDGAELAEFRAELCRRLELLADSLRAGNVVLLNSVPQGDDLRPELLERIERFLAAGAPLAPCIKGKR
jgi:hypothetical protein